MNKKGFTLIKKNCQGFTLIELLIAISIIGILTAVMLFGLLGIKDSTRDAKRKGDLESIRSGLELYRADCNTYPVGIVAGSPLVGTGATTSCSTSNVYVTTVPTDPSSPSRLYLYSQTATGYEMCASLEQSGLATVTCGGSSNCGSTCNYKVTNP